MDLSLYTTLFVLADRLFSTSLALVVGLVIWAFLCVLLAGLTAELAEAAGLRAPLGWATAVAVAPPVLLPIFLFCRERARSFGSYNHRACSFRRRGYAVAVLAIAILGVLQFATAHFVIAPEPPSATKLFRPLPALTF